LTSLKTNTQNLANNFSEFKKYKTSTILLRFKKNHFYLKVVF